jgi:hypothetical protein
MGNKNIKFKIISKRRIKERGDKITDMIFLNVINLVFIFYALL